MITSIEFILITNVNTFKKNKTRYESSMFSIYFSYFDLHLRYIFYRIMDIQRIVLTTNFLCFLFKETRNNTKDIQYVTYC